MSVKVFLNSFNTFTVISFHLNYWLNYTILLPVLQVFLPKGFFSKKIKIAISILFTKRGYYTQNEKTPIQANRVGAVFEKEYPKSRYHASVTAL